MNSELNTFCTITKEAVLRRSVMATLLGEGNYYESGITVKDRIKQLTKEVSPSFVRKLAIEAKEQFNLRHVPLFLIKCLIENLHYASTEIQEQERKLVKDTLVRIITRADDIIKFMELYWEEGKKPISNNVKKAISEAFNKFNDYHFKKYESKSKVITFRDIMFLTHTKPINEEKADTFKKIANKTLAPIVTWETVIHTAKDKKEAWKSLIKEKKVDNLSLLMNLKKILESEVSEDFLVEAINNMNSTGILPHQFTTAVKMIEHYNTKNKDIIQALEKQMLKGLNIYSKIKGKTIVLIDVSGSMEAVLSKRSTTSRLTAASSLTIMCKNICEEVKIYTFSNKLVHIKDPSRGFSLHNEIYNSQVHGSTELWESLKQLQSLEDADRIIVITDEQDNGHRGRITPKYNNNYLINVGNNQNGVGYGKWVHIDGFSSTVINWIIEYEKFITAFPAFKTQI